MGGFIRAFQLRTLAVLGMTAITLMASFAWPASVQAAFDKTNIVSDSTLFDKNSMTEANIANHLSSRGSGYANYTIPEYVTVAYPIGQGQWGYVAVRQWHDTTGAIFYGKTVARLIWEEAQEHGISPRFMLTHIQKESSGVTENIIGQPRDHWALGYGYPDQMDACYDSGAYCSPEEVAAYRQRAIDYGGVGQQIAYATSWFQRHYGDFNPPQPATGQSFNCMNRPTCLMYLYTPHIGGNQNFYNIFLGWFGDPGTVISYNDTSPIDTRTYGTSIRFNGSKEVDTEVYFGDEWVGTNGFISWGKDLNLPVGTYTNTVTYKKNGQVVATKSIKIVRQKEADINGDNSVNILDLSILSNSYGQKESADPMANLNPSVDNEVNLLDISIFANKWEG